MDPMLGTWKSIALVVAAPAIAEIGDVYPVWIGLRDWRGLSAAEQPQPVSSPPQHSSLASDLQQLLSGLLYQWQGLEACLWASVACVLAAAALSALLPAAPPIRGAGRALQESW